jgi:hypothetical protein
MAIKQEVNAPLLWTIGTVAGFLFLTIVMGLEAWYMWAEQTEQDAKNRVARNWILEARLEEQRAAIHRNGPIDANRFAMPIEQAMDEIVRSRGQLPGTPPAQ